MARSSANRVYTTAKARDRFSEVVNEASYGSKRVVLTRHGKSVAAVVSIAELKLLQEIERLLDIERAKRALVEAKSGRVKSLEDLRKELGIK
ncbi:MAG: type II toxin-antitoxin system Phd/YefM family antitoxin [Rhodospirillales bacterium]|nr:type II toxin-antitoxin system Phd/YefM family antitoxin [Rhodospirillales bacterium]